MPSLVETWDEQLRRKRIQLHLVSLWRLPPYTFWKVLRWHSCFQWNCVSLAEAVTGFDPNTTGAHSLKEGKGSLAPLHIQTRREACSQQSRGCSIHPSFCTTGFVCACARLSLISHALSIAAPTFYSSSSLCSVSGSFPARSLSIVKNWVFLLWNILNGKNPINYTSWTSLQDFFPVNSLQKFPYENEVHFHWR